MHTFILVHTLTPSGFVSASTALAAEKLHRTSCWLRGSVVAESAAEGVPLYLFELQPSSNDNDLFTPVFDLLFCASLSSRGSQRRRAPGSGSTPSPSCSSLGIFTTTCPTWDRCGTVLSSFAPWQPPSSLSTSGPTLRW